MEIPDQHYSLIKILRNNRIFLERQDYWIRSNNEITLKSAVDFFNIARIIGITSLDSRLEQLSFNFPIDQLRSRFVKINIEGEETIEFMDRYSGRFRYRQ